jgi:hypothetical protein
VTESDEPDESWDAGDMGCGELVFLLMLRLRSMRPGQPRLRLRDVRRQPDRVGGGRDREAEEHRRGCLRAPRASQAGALRPPELGATAALLEEPEPVFAKRVAIARALVLEPFGSLASAATELESSQSSRVVVQGARPPLRDRMMCGEQPGIGSYPAQVGAGQVPRGGAISRFRSRSACARRSALE